MNKYTTILSEFNQNSLAPSERHLEDWILSNPRLVRDQICDPDDYTDGYWYYIHRIVNRQVRLPSGRADLIAVVYQNTEKCLAPIEIKKGVIDYKTVGQCLRYMRDLREIFLRAKHPGIDSPIYIEANYRPNGIAEQLLGYSPEVTGIVIGHSIEDFNLLAACRASNIDVITYEFKDNQYYFTGHTDPTEFRFQESYSNMAYGAIGDAFREVIEDRIKQALRHKKIDGEAS